ncbi:hypothetical protein FACS1894181_05250 [Bacteroidia bacterium]|nr:hypothetical protein FACS1894181_05250 [Bacteroidia bacterium]
MVVGIKIFPTFAVESSNDGEIVHSTSVGRINGNPTNIPTFVENKNGGKRVNSTFVEWVNRNPI